jgi:hypothetical protein
MFIPGPKRGKGGGKGGSQRARIVDADLPGFGGGKTEGVFIRPDGTVVPLISGLQGPASAYRGQYVPGMNRTTKTHVEAHAAAIMRLEKLGEGTLVLNRSPCQGINLCSHLLPRMVPKGSTMIVIVKLVARLVGSRRSSLCMVQDDDTRS